MDADATDAADSLPAPLLADDVAEYTELAGGFANPVWMLTHTDGAKTVVKATSQPLPGIFAAEAEGLAALRGSGAVITPRVLDVAESTITLEAMNPTCPDDDEFWAAAGRSVAGLHLVRGDHFGWHSDNWLGRLPQENTWSDDGHEFFATHRVLRFLREPQAEQLLTAADRADIEKVCAKLPELVPTQAPALTHGDLWRNNIVQAADGRPALIDPAVSWMWPDVDVAMMHYGDRIPETFFDAYSEVRPLDDGWRERMPVLDLREMLADLCHDGHLRWDVVGRIRQTVKRFR